MKLMRCYWIAGVIAAAACGCAEGPGGLETGGAGSRQGAAARPSPYRIRRCKLDVVLEPKTHRIEATAELAVARRPDAAAAPKEKFRFQLNRDLWIDSVTFAGAPLYLRRLPGVPDQKPGDEADEDADKSVPPTVYELNWRPPPDRPGPLVIRYGGRLYQDVAAGEKPGEIHNFQMSAHIGEEGIYLDADGAWYPQIPDTDDENPKRETAPTQFELTVTAVPGRVLVACGNRDGAGLNAPRGERTTWRTPFPIDGMTLVGGLHQVFQRQVGGVLVSVHVAQEHAAMAPGILDAVESYLMLYQPLIGPYPLAEFTVVENFFSSGFAFPGFTVLASAVIGMGPMGLQPGYLDHEMLHNWWGNGVRISALDGNWCECLTSYCANYMRHVLEGRNDKARAQRRDICFGLSRLSPEKDKPLDQFGRDEGPGGFIGYQKGSMVFAMLAQKVGTDTLWRALRRLAAERLGKPTGWNDIKQAVEQESSVALDAFFKMWVRGSGVPEIVIDDVRYDAQARRLNVTLLQKGDRVFDVTVPMRLVFDGGEATDEAITVNKRAQVATIHSLRAPRFVELDPDFHVMRRVPLRDVMPTISGIGKSKSLLIVRHEDDADAYDPVVDRMKKRYEKAEDTKVQEKQAADLTVADFKQGHVLLLGRACLAPAVKQAGLLNPGPLAIGDGYFQIDKTRYDRPDNEVLCCLRNTRDDGGVICLYTGNSAADLKKAGVITFYGGNSLVVFEGGKAIRRQDFEQVEQVAVQH